MDYTFSEDGLIQRVGFDLSHVGERLPQRMETFSVGYALGGLIMGSITGFGMSMLVKIIMLLVSLRNEIEFMEPEAISAMIFTSEFAFSGGVIAAIITFAVIGFIWDGLEATGDTFLMSMGAFGFIIGGFIGAVISLLLITVIASYYILTDMQYTVMIVSAVSVFALFGFLWNGFETCRDTFSILRSLLGLICGFLKGIWKVIILVFTNGCFVIILVIVLSPLATAAAILIIGYYTIKGCIVVGRGRDWNSI
ncbi:MAG: hypothetical protein LBD23_06590 [Oscillospiraceae bacterium]|jgi:hypothetical protein|nr:hypothetical protein [Oscillospiraceae bacterium]